MPAHVFQAPVTAYVHGFRVQDTDIDGLGHANNVVWVRWLNEAAIAHASHVGMGLSACRQLGVVWVVRRHDLEYLLPAFVGEEIEAVTWPETLRAATSLRRTVFQRQGQLLARAETTWVLLDVSTGKPCRIPPPMLSSYGF